eukprot:scaffold42542_cov65-Phaeocystis_antarctica.AAC.2
MAKLCSRWRAAVRSSYSMSTTRLCTSTTDSSESSDSSRTDSPRSTSPTERGGPLQRSHANAREVRTKVKASRRRMPADRARRRRVARRS